MSTTLKVRPCVLEARERLSEGRAKLQQQHASASPGVQVCTLLTNLLDDVVLLLFDAAVAEMPTAVAEVLRDEVALVPNGGYGRRDVAPFSDVDLMILHTRRADKHVAPLAKRLLVDVFDAGLMLGQAVRTPAQACHEALKDSTIFTSLAEARFLGGSQELFDHFANRFKRMAARRWRGLVAAIDAARREERQQFGETVYLLEPNVKRSQGGLRDIQLLRWVGFARFGDADPEGLAMAGELTKEEQRSIRDAREFLLRLRNELHFHAGKAQDTLDRAEQVRIAEAFGYSASAALLPVEHFMRQYFRHTRGVSQIVTRFIERIRPGRRWLAFFAPLLTRQVEGDFRIGPARIYVARAGLSKLQSDLTEVLRLMELASTYNRPIAPATWDAIRRAAPSLSTELSATAIERFLALLSHSTRLGVALRDLHELGVLERILPDFSHARCLLQFNEYHKYTVDEHSLRAVEICTEFQTDRGPLGHAYRGLANKRTLHLALLIHDLGKGYVEDHSEVGRRIAIETAARLKLPAAEGQALEFLVHQHLMMAHLAFRRDTGDEQVVIRFAADVGSADRLRMLYLLTAADISAVGPGVWNEWKGEVLTDLYHRALEHLTGETPEGAYSERLATRTASAVERLRDDEDREWFQQQFEAFPPHYRLRTAPEQIVGDLRQLKKLSRGNVAAAARWLGESKTVEFTVGTYDDITPGVFHKLTGALTGKGLQILSAEINTLAHGLVFDRFFVTDPDFSGEPHATRLEAVNQALREALLHPTGEKPAFRKTWKAGATRHPETLSQLTTEVRIDNNFSQRYTIIDVFAHDRIGLLYTITRTLFELGLSVAVAKIGTYLDQVVDVFYVTDREGNKVSDDQRCQAIRAAVLSAIAALELEPAHA